MYYAIYTFLLTVCSSYSIFWDKKQVKTAFFLHFFYLSSHVATVFQNLQNFPNLQNLQKAKEPKVSSHRQKEPWGTGKKNPFGVLPKGFRIRFKLSAYFWFFLRRAEAQRLPISSVANVPGSGWPLVNVSPLPLKSSTFTL